MESKTTLLRCITDMAKKEGILSYYKGMESPLVTVPLVNAIVFGSYEMYKAIIHVESDE